MAKAESGSKLRRSAQLVGHAAEMLKAVGHPLRLGIVAQLCRSEQHVSALAESLGAKQSVISQQLKILRMHGLVEAQRRDGFSVYRITEPRLRDLVNCVEGCVARQT